jgi:dTDP-4-dehydrorhamnose reductase
VLGATGMLGHRVVAHFAASGHEVHSAVRDPARARELGIPEPLHAFDAFDGDGVRALIAAVEPTAVVNAVGLVKQLDEASRPIPAIAINALFPHQLADACAARDAKLVHVSTDCVFSGELPAPAAYTEESVPDARDLYGRSKLLGEVGYAPALTLRTSIVGRELERASGLLEWFAGQDGNAVDGYANALFSGLTTGALAAVVEQVLADHRDLAGLYHVSADPISKLDLITRLADVLGVDAEIRPVDEPRVNRVLDSTNFRQQTGIGIPSWTEMLAEYGGSDA